MGLSFLDNYGHFYGRLEGPVHGNVLLRRKQYLVEYDYEEKTKLAVGFVLTKIANSRNTLLRAARDTTDHMTLKKLSSAAKELAKIAESLKTSNDLDTLRGHEGRAGAIYFSVFNYMIKQNKEDFYFKERSEGLRVISQCLVVILVCSAITYKICSGNGRVGSCMRVSTCT